MEGILNNKINLLKFTSEYDFEMNKNFSIIFNNKEFIKSYDNKYILQNKNGNLFIRHQLENEYKLYNLPISWVLMYSKNMKPYKEVNN